MVEDGFRGICLYIYAERSYIYIELGYLLFPYTINLAIWHEVLVSNVLIKLAYLLYAILLPIFLTRPAMLPENSFQPVFVTANIPRVLREVHFTVWMRNLQNVSDLAPSTNSTKNALI